MIKAIIVDDEPYSCESLATLLERYCPAVKVADICYSGEDALKAIEEQQPQIVFLDIEMPKMNGFEMLEKLPEIHFEIIFTTSYDQYAIKAIRFSALDYLLKPINAEELRNAVGRFLEKRDQQLQTDALLKNLLHNLEIKKESEFKLAIPSISGALFFSPAEIIRLEGEGNYTRFSFTDGHSLLVAYTLKNYEVMLAAQGFLRVHKSHLVNTAHVKSYKDNALIMADQSIVEISRRRKEDVLEALRKNV